MAEPNENDQAVLDSLARGAGLPNSVRVSAELAELLRPNTFLESLGIRYEERLKTILEIVRANLIPKSGGPQETLPDRSVVIPFTIVKGPYIREEQVSIQAKLTDDGGGKMEILLAPIFDSE